MRPAPLGTALLLSFVVAAPAAAQGSIAHDGFWIGAGAGYGWSDYGDRPDDARGGFSGHIRAGGTLRPNLLAGGESNGFYRIDQGVNYFWGALMGTVSWYPVRTLPVFVKGGAGYLYTFASEAISVEITSGHLAVQAGLGYDIHLGDHTALTVVANWIKGFEGNLQIKGTTIDRVSPQLLQLGVAFSLY
ncbi:MAG: porin family protein [Gemmatimonadales bacterium]|nr:porin family protein [Gemmatimonadales bacterium]